MYLTKIKQLPLVLNCNCATIRYTTCNLLSLPSEIDTGAFMTFIAVVERRRLTDGVDALQLLPLMSGASKYKATP